MADVADVFRSFVLFDQQLKAQTYSVYYSRKLRKTFEQLEPVMVCVNN